MTFSLISDPNRSGLTRLTFVELVRPYSYFFWWSWTVVSPTEYFRPLQEFSWIETYLTIFSISSLINVTYFLFWGNVWDCSWKSFKLYSTHPNVVLWYLNCGSRTCKAWWKVVENEAYFLLYIKEFAHLLLTL